MDSRQCLFTFDDQSQVMRLNSIEEVEKWVMGFGMRTTLRLQARTEWRGKLGEEWRTRRAKEAESGNAGS